MKRDEKSERRAKLRDWRDAEHAKARLAFPLSDEQLGAFFAGVESLQEQHGCAHDTRHSEATMSSLGLAPSDVKRVLAWCGENGGFCDCEIAGNTFQHWEECRERL